MTQFWEDAKQVYEERIAELEAENNELKNHKHLLLAANHKNVVEKRILNLRLESLLQETCVIDEATGNVYEDGFHNPDLVATLIASTILSSRPADDEEKS